ncbi:GNAT family N-acetyltransferase [Haploplasma axanthum]|uniref:Uncharacterized N-acetyltransferase YjaB n=1 Tax=Haploplasma axanthum TaxID=29552 RepID=A0A449BCC1_HAPAX|nr:GNAT family N-acetyltransferase [Haploplasma axanthum]VEU80082.1 Uncharacterized N-acetyltransferase YjaB [Haploplasma axanthum]
MIRKMNKKDIPNILNLWLETNLEAHSFIDNAYFVSNVNNVKEELSDAIVYVYEENEEIIGFIGLEDNYIAGIFIDSKYQGKGIGNELLSKVKEIDENLTLKVYAKNEKALNFYKKQGFIIVHEVLDEVNNEKELVMVYTTKKQA